MKRLGAMLFIIILLTSCLGRQQPEEIVLSDEEEQQEISMVPTHRLSSENYKVMLPYRPSDARGVIVDQVANRYDIDELEDGLRRHSKEYFDPEDYYFEEGQYLTRDTVYGWLGRKITKKELEKERDAIVSQRKKEGYTINDEVIKDIEKELQQGLNPILEDLDGLDRKERQKLHEESPRYISHVLEQNYLQRTDEDSVELVGISLALSMKSVYQYKAESDGPNFYHEISESEMLSEGKKMADTILERMRDIDGVGEIPILLTIFREAEHASPIPGNFVAKAFVDQGETSIDEWETIEEEYVLFPSNAAKEKYFDEHEIITSFGHKIADFFPNYTGIVGEGFYMKDELQRMKVKIPLEFYGSGEILGFTQYIYGIAQETFSTNYDLEIHVESREQLEALIYREANDEKLKVHILH